jgi:hypothetical protein
MSDVEAVEEAGRQLRHDQRDGRCDQDIQVLDVEARGG